MRCVSIGLFLSCLAAPVSGQVAGSFVPSFEGCPDASLLYEVFPGGSFDLAGGQSLDWAPNNGLGYLVFRGGNGLLPTTGGLNLRMANQSLSGPLSLGFPLTYPSRYAQRTTNQIEVSDNGWVYMQPGTATSTRCCSATPQVLRAFREETPSWAVLGRDLDPGPAGNVFFNTSPGRAWVTWEQVPMFGQTQPNTLQIQFASSGIVSMVWSQVATSTLPAVVGWSAGGGVDDDGPVDLSAIVPFDMGPSYGPFTIDAPLARLPTVGSPFVIDLDNAPPDAVFGALLFAATPAQFSLTPYGFTGCDLLIGPQIATFPLSLMPPFGSATVPIPANPALTGALLEGQAAVVSPSVNPGLLATSNRGTLTVGNLSSPVLVVADGLDNENADETSGFWQVINASTQGIQAVRFDWVASSVPNSYYFDTNQSGMADRFDGGNSRTPLCQGTYRNGSDLITGLDYTVSALGPCGAAARSGWVGSVPGRSPGDYRRLDFQFTDFNPGEVFEFDADTDGGPGNGGAMAGMVVTVTFVGGAQRTGQLVRGSATQSRVGL